MSMLMKKLFSKKNHDGVVDVEENTHQGSKKKKSSKNTKKNKRKEEEQQPDPPQVDAHGDALAQEEEDDDTISKASEATSEHGNGDGDGEAEETLDPEPTNSVAEAGKLEQGDAPVEKTVTVIEESRVRVSEEEDSSAAASGESESRVSPIAEADKAVDFPTPEASQITEVAPRATLAAHHATWWNCCGILDAFVESK